MDKEIYINGQKMTDDLIANLTISDVKKMLNDALPSNKIFNIFILADIFQNADQLENRFDILDYLSEQILVELSNSN